MTVLGKKTATSWGTCCAASVFSPGVQLTVIRNATGNILITIQKLMNFMKIIWEAIWPDPM
jgi:hypothetical protein